MSSYNFALNNAELEITYITSYIPLTYLNNMLYYNDAINGHDNKNILTSQVEAITNLSIG